MVTRNIKFGGRTVWIVSLAVILALSIPLFEGHWTSFGISTQSVSDFSGGQKDVASPVNRIRMDQIFVHEDEVVIKLKSPKWAIFTDTNSMDPVIDSTTKAIQVVPQADNDINVGDIVAYESRYKEGIVTHRVVEINSDENGWYSRLKGDNNDYVDPGKVRFEQIRRVVIAVIY